MGKLWLIICTLLAQNFRINIPLKHERSNSGQKRKKMTKVNEIHLDFFPEDIRNALRCRNDHL